MWANREGWPVGVVMSYVFRDGSFWLTASGQRLRVAAVSRDPRVAIAVTSKGTTIEHAQTATRGSAPCTTPPQRSRGSTRRWSTSSAPWKRSSRRPMRPDAETVTLVLDTVLEI